MSLLKILGVIVCVLVLCSGFGIQIQGETGVEILRDEIGNVTDAQLNSIKKYIKEAEAQYNSTDYTRIAKYVFTGMKNSSSGMKWNVYVHAGKINQIGLSSELIYRRKYIWLLNYGDYNLTYTLFAINSALCSQYQEFGGGAGLAQFGQAVNSTDQQKILAVINDSILYKGDDIEQAAAYIENKVGRALGYGIWATVIADPTTKYGYYICRTISEKWFALREYKDFKWNYFSAMH